jgi:glutamate racemase
MIGFFDSGFGGSTVLKAVLQEIPEYDLKKTGKIRKFYITDSVERFKLLGERFLGEKMMEIEKVILS